MLSAYNSHESLFLSAGAPQIVRLSGPVVGQFERTVRIPCGAEVRGHPLPSYHWLYQNVPGSEFRALPSNRFSTDPESGVLELSVAQYDDFGFYQCNATNSIGSSTVLVSLLVLGMQRTLIKILCTVYISMPIKIPIFVWLDPTCGISCTHIN